MKGFRDFLMRGNLVELAVAVIIGGAFGAVVTTFTQVILDIVGLIGGNPDFSTVSIGPIVVGPFINAVVSFLIVATIVYFGVIKPIDAIENLRRTDVDQAPPKPTTEDLLTEIRDLLREQRQPG